MNQEEFVRRFLAEIPCLVELHRSRLRDMHMHVPGGFDQPKMVRDLEALVRPVLAESIASKASFAAWLREVNQRMAEALPAPAADASVTEKATYGMAQLILTGGQRQAKAIRENAELFERCHEAFAWLGGTRPH